MGDLAQQIRDRLDGWLPEMPPGEAPAMFLEPAHPLSPDEIERWQKAFDDLLGSESPGMRILPPGPRFYPGFEQMRDAIIAVLELHSDEELDMCVAEQVGYTVMRWHKPSDDPTLLAIAEKLGIEAQDA